MGELIRGQRLQIMLSPTELRALDTWRFKTRMPSRASAIRELLKRGLAAEGFLEAEEGLSSKNFSVLNAWPPAAMFAPPAEGFRTVGPKQRFRRLANHVRWSSGSRRAGGIANFSLGPSPDVAR